MQPEELCCKDDKGQHCMQSVQQQARTFAQTSKQLMQQKLMRYLPHDSQSHLQLLILQSLNLHLQLRQQPWASSPGPPALAAPGLGTAAGSPVLMDLGI